MNISPGTKLVKQPKFSFSAGKHQTDLLKQFNKNSISAIQEHCSVQHLLQWMHFSIYFIVMQSIFENID